MDRSVASDYSSPCVATSVRREAPPQPSVASRNPSVTRKRIWIDIDNSPHVPFFKPIMEELEKRGFEIILTARDTYQVCDLLKFHQLSCKVVGRHYGKSKLMKV